MPKTKASVAVGRFVSGVRVFARMSGETPNSPGLLWRLNVAAAEATASPPAAGKSPKDPR